MDIYIRVSRVGKREGESYRSPDIQREECERWIGREELKVGRVIEDEDVSGGKKVEERGLEELIARAERGESDGVVVYALDRFGRDELDAAVAVKRLQDAGARLVSATEGIDSSRSDTGSKMALRMMLLIAEAYLDRVKSNWKHATERAVADGIHIACRAPTGYRRNGGKRLVEDGPDADAVRECFRNRAGGMSWRQCNRALEVALARSISPSTARRIVQNPVYLGQARGPGGLTNDKAHEAIVTPELWAAANNVRGPKLPKDGSVANRARLRGLVYCATCGRKMGVGRMNKAGDASYVCNQKYPGGPCSTGGAASAKLVDSHVIWMLASNQSGADEAASSELERALRLREEVAEKERVRVELVESSARLIASLGVDGYAKAADENMAALEKARAELYALPEIHEDASVVWSNGKPLVHYVVGGDPEQDRRVLRRYVGRVVVTKSTRGRWQPIEERVEVEWVDGSRPELKPKRLSLAGV